MKKYIFSLVCLCCALLPALEGQAALHEHPEYPDLRKSDANIVGHILDKNTKEHLPYITVALKGTTIGIRGEKRNVSICGRLEND